MKSAGTAITHQVVNDKTARASKDGRRYLAMAYEPPDTIKAAAGELFIYISYDPTLAALAKKIVTASGKAYYSPKADAAEWRPSESPPEAQNRSPTRIDGVPAPYSRG